MKWTSKLPQTPGYYWVQLKNNYIDLVCISVTHESYEILLENFGGENFDVLYSELESVDDANVRLQRIKDIYRYWQGPLKIPNPIKAIQ